MVIGLTGYARSGKNSVADVLVKEYGFTQMAFADALREMAAGINPLIATQTEMDDEPGQPLYYNDFVALRGYEGAKKHPEVRRFLQRLGTEGVRDVLGPDVWIDAVRAKLKAMFYPNKLAMQSGRPHVVLTDVRFPNEYKFVADIGEVWRTVRTGEGEGTKPANDHPSETNADTLSPSRTVVAGNLEELQSEVRRLMKGVRL